MHSAFSSALVVSAIMGAASAHGIVGWIKHNGVDYTGWKVWSDRFDSPVPIRAIRPFRDNGPVDDFTTEDIICNNAPNLDLNPIPGNDGSTTLSIPVKNGDTLKYVWESWNIWHPGPVMTYLANCNGDCKTFKGNKGAVWVKIDQISFNKDRTPMWGSEVLMAQNATWDITVPKNLAPGEYVIRHEILGLQAAMGSPKGAQFYPSCAHLSVTGDGTTELPTGVPLPGAYSPDDTKGIRMYWWEAEAGTVEYVAPGGPVWDGAAPQMNGLDVDLCEKWRRAMPDRDIKC